jgi:hypothetical protein
MHALLWKSASIIEALYNMNVVQMNENIGRPAYPLEQIPKHKN